MRKAQKQQVEELVLQMQEAQDQIKKYIEQQNISYAMQLLEDCQNGAITIGTLIEKQKVRRIQQLYCWKNIANWFIRFTKV